MLSTSTLICWKWNLYSRQKKLFAKWIRTSKGNICSMPQLNVNILTITSSCHCFVCKILLLWGLNLINNLYMNMVESFSWNYWGSFQDEMFYFNFNTAKCQRDLIVVKLWFKKTVLESCGKSLCCFNQS